ncbi:MAG: lipopolysaccharide transport periplasmic protein LptA [Desulfofustis sp.]|jgi:lipopolysaccharide export system protein LptA
MGKIKIFSIYATLLFIICCVFQPVAGAKEKEPPIVVEADQMSSTEESNTVLFLGNVDAKQGDLRILSDEMTVYYHEAATKDQEADTEQKIEKLVCVGNVELSSAEWLGTSDQMIYYSGNRKVMLIGDAKAWQGENMIAGEKIVYYIDEGRSEVVGGTTTVIGEGEKKEEKKQRVKMTIMQK